MALLFAEKIFYNISLFKIGQKYRKSIVRFRFIFYIYF